MLESGTIVGGKYTIDKVLGHGGMSVVYLAHDANGACYAIKDVERVGTDRHSSNQNVYTQSLAAEGKMLKNLSNPHLPKIYDILEDVNSFMMVMDYVEGKSLDKVIEETGPQAVEDIYAWAIQICTVFDYLHSQPQPVIYRDMKPANVILQPNGNIMMIDFGTARTQKVGVNMSSDTVCIGTEGFAAPEQYGGISQSDARTDIFCLGATLYNLLTGHSPCDPPRGILPLAQIAPEQENTPLDYIIRKCTRSDPNERYQSAQELRDALIAARDGSFFSERRGLSGLLQKPGWQQQHIKGQGGNTGGLSGLLGLGKAHTGGTGVLTGQMETPEMTPLVPQEEQPPIEELGAPEEQKTNLWSRLMLVFAVASVLFLGMSILGAVIGESILTVVFIALTVIVVALTVLSLVMAQRER